MSLRLEMLQVARLAPKLLGESCTPLTAFLHEQFNEDGGVRDRSGQSDLYYTVFGLQCLAALQVALPVVSVLPYLRRFEAGEHLDLVHATCLARCWAALPAGSFGKDHARRLARHIESFRSLDGGYSAQPGAQTGTVYHCFLALGAYQDLQEEMPNREGLARCLRGLRTADGAYANERQVSVGTTPATAAGVTLLRHLGLSVPPSLGDWLLGRCHAQGGFLAMPSTPMPDVLSTATALHALAGMHVSLEAVKERCLDFLDSLWTGRAFCGHWMDDVQDCEYTYYALLALGHLSL